MQHVALEENILSGKRIEMFCLPGSIFKLKFLRIVTSGRFSYANVTLSNSIALKDFIDSLSFFN